MTNEARLTKGQENIGRAIIAALALAMAALAILFASWTLRAMKRCATPLAPS